MKFTSLKVNSEVEYSGVKFNIVSIEPPYITLINASNSAKPIQIKFHDLVTDSSFKPSNHIVNKLNNDKNEYYSVLDGLNEKKRERVSKRLEMIRPILVFGRAKEGQITAYIEFMDSYSSLIHEGETLESITQELILDRVSKQYKISKRSIQRYLSSYREMDLIKPNKGEEGLIPKDGTGYKFRTDNNIIEICHPKYPDVLLHTINSRLTKEHGAIIKSVIEKEYLKNIRKSKKAIYDLIAIQCNKNKIDIPKKITIYKMLERIPTQVLERFRYGSSVTEKYMDIQRGYANEEALYPLHIVEIDHTKLDVDVLDEKTGLVSGRPWITLGIDVYTRMVWCMHISFEPPSSNKVRKAIEHGVLMKKTKEKYNTTKEWEIFGIPQNIVLDNGSEFNNAETKRMINEVLKSNVRFRPVGTPRYGGTIERLFRTLNMEVIHQLEGTRKSNIFDLGEYDAEKNAILTLADLEEILTKHITDIYHFKKNKGLPLDSNTPIVRYYEGLKLCGLPDFIDKEEEETFKIDLLPTILKPYTRDGIRMMNVFYRRTDLSNLIDKREVKYVVKYDIDDISYIYIKLPDSSKFVKVLASYPSYTNLKNMNQYTYKMLTKILREQGKIKRSTLMSESDLLKEKEKLQKIILEKYKTNRRVRQQALKMDFEVDIKDKVNLTSGVQELTYEQILEKAKRAHKDNM